MPSPTNLITARILAYLLEKGCFAWRQSTQGLYDAKRGIFRPARKVGVPDILAVCPPKGYFLGVEVKTDKDRPSPEQLGFFDSVHHVGGCSMFVKDFDDFLNQFNKFVCPKLPKK